MGEGYLRRRVASAAVRVLIYLMCTMEGGESDVHLLTQEGIAGGIRSGRSTVAKALLRLDALDFVAGRREHVPGHRLRKHVYRLTEEGWDEAVRERARVGNTVVTVRGLGPRRLRVRASDLPGLLPSAGDISRILARVERGALSSRDLDSVDTEPCLPVAWGVDRPKPRKLIGRKREAQELDAWLGSQSSILIVTGLAGIGKTALVAAAVATWRPRHALCWSVIRPWSSAAALTADLAKFLGATGRRELERALVNRAELEETTVRGLLEHGFRGFRAVLVFDDIHTARPAVRRWFGLLTSAIESTQCQVIFVGRMPVKIEASGPGTRRPQELNVGPLDNLAATEFLRVQGWNPGDPVAADILRRARGNPLLLLLGAEAGTGAGGEIARFLEDEVWSGLTRAERRSLEAVSCFRRGGPDRAVLAMSGVDAEALVSLERKSLLGRTAAGAYALHPSIDEFVRARTPGLRARACHTAAVRYFLTVPDPTAKLEAIYHAIESGKPDAAADLLRREGESLLNSVSFAPLRDILETVNPASLPPAAGAVLAEAQGDIYRRGGFVRPADARYDQALRLADGLRQPGDRARILRKLAELDRFAARQARARERLTEAARLVAASKDHREASNVHRELALLEMAQGNLKEAEDHLKTALRTARVANDPARFSRALLVFGSLEAARGQPAVGLKRKLNALRSAETSGELLEVARNAISVGVSCAEMKRFVDALPYYEQGLEVAQLLGDVRLMALAQLNRSAALLDLGRWSEARPALAEADRLSSLIGEVITRGFIALAVGQLEMSSGHWRRAVDAFESGLQILRAHGGPYDLARGLMDVSGFYSERGEKALAMERLQEALDLAHALTNDGLASEISRKLELLQGPLPLSR